MILLSLRASVATLLQWIPHLDPFGTQTPCNVDFPENYEATKDVAWIQFQNLKD